MERQNCDSTRYVRSGGDRTSATAGALPIALRGATEPLPPLSEAELWLGYRGAIPPALRLEGLEAAIARMRRILQAGRWPDGPALTYLDVRTVEWNLELAILDREKLRREIRA